MWRFTLGFLLIILHSPTESPQRWATRRRAHPPPIPVQSSWSPSTLWGRCRFFSRSSVQMHEALKGQCHEIFDFRFFVMNRFPPSPWVSYQGRFKFFQKFAEIFAAQGTPPVSLIQDILFGHLWVDGVKFLQVTLRCKQSDIVPIICQRYRLYRWCEFSTNKLKWPLCYFQGLGRRWFIKNLQQKISCHCPFKGIIVQYIEYQSFCEVV